MTLNAHSYRTTSELRDPLADLKSAVPVHWCRADDAQSVFASWSAVYPTTPSSRHRTLSLIGERDVGESVLDDVYSSWSKVSIKQEMRHSAS